jgi:hypothetical protein
MRGKEEPAVTLLAVVRFEMLDKRDIIRVCAALAMLGKTDPDIHCF